MAGRRASLSSAQNRSTPPYLATGGVGGVGQRAAVASRKLYRALIRIMFLRQVGETHKNCHQAFICIVDGTQSADRADDQRAHSPSLGARRLLASRGLVVQVEDRFCRALQCDRHLRRVNKPIDRQQTDYFSSTCAACRAARRLSRFRIDCVSLDGRHDAHLRVAHRLLLIFEHTTASPSTLAARRGRLLVQR